MRLSRDWVKAGPDMPCLIDLNFSSSKDMPSLPIRRWRNRTGIPSSIAMATATNSNMGKTASNARAANTRIMEIQLQQMYCEN
jgi:hypothetical protein